MDADVAGVNQLSERIIGCAFRVVNTLGHGFVEKVYENALAHELRKAGLLVRQQHGIAVTMMRSWLDSMRLICLSKRPC